METKPDGRRVKMTKLLLKNSLIDLMKQKSIHNVSIKEICEGADVNRSTFYRHYNTQYELYDDIMQDISDDIEVLFNEKSSSLNFLTAVLEYIEKNRDTFLVILSGNGNMSMGEAFNIMTEKFIDKTQLSEMGVYVAQFVSAGITSTLWTWLNKEKRRPAHELATLIYYLMMHGLKRAIDFAPAPKSESKD